MVSQRLRLSVLAAAGYLMFAGAMGQLANRPQPKVSVEMEVVLPRAVQVLMAAGDRYLAANLAGFRALVVSTERMTRENFRILAQVQTDVAWFNPAHEDNYYIATGVLPWNGEVEATQYILRRASQARPTDWTPAFHHAFNLLHFYRQPIEAASWLAIAAEHASDEEDRIMLQDMASAWALRGGDPDLAIRIIRGMAKESRHKAFARYLNQRADRLQSERDSRGLPPNGRKVGVQ